MMRKTQILMGALGFALACSCMAGAQDHEVPGGAASGQAAAPEKVADALGKLKMFNGSANPNAKVYIYLQSAGWCGPCQREMPVIVQEYEKMKQDGRVELVLVSYDRTEEAAKAFLAKHNAPFAAVMKDDEGLSSLPGYSKASGIPRLIMVDAKGNVLCSGHPGRFLASWKDLADKVEPEAKDQP